MMRLNYTGLEHAKQLIRHGKISTGPWAYDAVDEQTQKGPNGTDHAEHERHHLAIDDAHPVGHEDRARYPFAKDGQIYLRALHGIRNEAHDAGQTDISRAASELIGEAKVRQTPHERHIVKDGSKWKLYTKDGSRLISTHASKEGAVKQEEAIKAHEADAAAGRSAEVRDKTGSSRSIERRFVGAQVELRESRTGGPGRIEGYAATFESNSVDLGGFIERLAPGAFRAALAAGDDCRCLRNHEDDNLLGRRSAGTLELSEDSHGLRFACELPNTQVGRDTAEMVRRKDMTGCSFQFTMGGPDDEAWDFSTPMPVRTIKRVGKLFDVGPVTFPAYESTRVDMRSFAAAKALHASPPKTNSQAKARQRLAEASL